ncbi:MAG: glycosyltransferase [Flavobacteriales bacterium]
MHGPKSWNHTAEKNSRAERQMGLNSRSYTYGNLLNPLFWFTILFKANVLHFYTGYFLLPLSQNHHELYSRLAGLELRFLQLLGKKIVLHFQGCEIRDRFHPLAQSVCSQCKIKDQFCSPSRSTNRRKRLLKLCQIADAVTVSTPDLVTYLKRANIHLIPKIVEVNKELLSTSSKVNSKLNIIHAPTDRSIKGTDRIIEVLSRHQDKFELVLAEQMTREQVFSLAQSADLAIDQIRVGWYGNFAVEMMSLNLPVLAYIRQDLLNAALPLQLPIINAGEHNLEDVLIQIWENRDQLREIGAKSRKFVSDFHSEAAVAGKLREIYNSFS